MAKQTALKKFTSEAVIENHSYKSVTTMFILDARDVIEVKNDHYYIADKIIRSADQGFVKLELRGRYAYGVIKRGNKKDLHARHLFNIDMVVHLEDKQWITPIYYFHENNKERGMEQTIAWLNTVYGSNPIAASKPQIKKVMSWVVDCYSKDSRPVADFTIHQMASSMIVDDALDKLVDAKCITKQTINHSKGSFNAYVPTDKGKAALGK